MDAAIDQRGAASRAMRPARLSSSLSERASRRMQRAKATRTIVSTRSALVRHPLARAKSRVCRGLTAATRTSSPLVASSTLSVGAASARHRYASSDLPWRRRFQQIFPRPLHSFSLPFLANMGLQAQATVRVSGEKPTGRFVLSHGIAILQKPLFQGCCELSSRDRQKHVNSCCFAQQRKHARATEGRKRIAGRFGG